MQQNKNSSLPCSGTGPEVCWKYKGTIISEFLVFFNNERGLPTAQFELFHDITDFLKAMDVCMLPSNRMGDH